MNTDKLQIAENAPSRVFQSKKETPSFQWEDNRTQFAAQARLKEAIQRMPEDEDELLQGKFVAQRAEMEEDDLLQGKFVAQRAEMDEDELLQGKFTAQRAEADTAAVHPTLAPMIPTFGADMLSSVQLHPDSSTPEQVGALAYTQGTDIHFAPGQFKPDTQAGRQLIGHELAHVAQQASGRVQPTTEIGGMPVNDDPSLEREADMIGAKAAL